MRIQALVAVVVAAIAALTTAMPGSNGAISMNSGASATRQPAGKIDTVDVIGLKNTGRAEGRT